MAGAWMGVILSIVLITLSGLLFVPILLFCIEVFAALFLRGHEPALPLDGRDRPTAAILIPAHNESDGLLATLDGVKPQLGCRRSYSPRGR